MLWRGLAFGLSAEEEDRYRTSSLAADVAQARLVIPPILVVTIAHITRFQAPIQGARPAAAPTRARARVAGLSHGDRPAEKG